MTGRRARDSRALKDRELEVTFEQRAPDDRGLAAEVLDRIEVFGRPDSARSEHRQPRALADDLEQVQVRPPECSVAVNRGAEETGHSRGCAPLGSLSRSDLGGLGPPGGDNASCANVDGDDEAVVERIPILLERARSGEGCGTDDDPRSAGGEQRLRIRDRANSTRGLDPGRRGNLCEAPHDVGSRPTGPRAVQVDDVDQCRARSHEPLEERVRIGLAGDDAVERTTLEPNGHFPEEVERRNHLEADPLLGSVSLC